MGRVDGKVALITGAARGQGRSHALRLAEEGADIIAVDICRQVASVPFPMARPEQLDETAQLIEDLDRRAIALQADVRDFGQIQAAVEQGIQELGHIDVVCANAGIGSYAPAWELNEEQWDDVVDTNLKGTWHTCKAAIPHMIARGQGGSLILTSSTAGIKGLPNMVHYAAAKHGVVGVMRTLAIELAPYMIRVNTVNPTSVDTGMIHNEATYTLFMGGRAGATRDDVAPIFQSLNLLPVPWVEPRDISNAVLWLASDESRYVTGVVLPVDAGSNQK